MRENVILACSGRFHHFHLARQLEKQGRLKCIVSGYPRFKLKDEAGIPPSKIITVPFWRLLPIGLSRFGYRNEGFSQDCAQRLHRSVARRAAREVEQGDIVIGLSASGLEAGLEAKRKGGYYICDRGSSHIEYQNDLLHEEYQRWGMKWKGVDPRTIGRETVEYDTADFISIPSDFTKRSFLSKGLPPRKVRQIQYGARLDRFNPVAEPDSGHFTILWVGAVSLRKGFLDALHAFQQFDHPTKRMRVIGHVEERMKLLLQQENLGNVEMLGSVPNIHLPQYYSESDVFLFPSIEDGFGMVMGESMACGCPVIASENTGGRDLFEDGVNGFEVPIRDPEAITETLRKIASMSPDERKTLRSAARTKIQGLGGWADYGDAWSKLLEDLDAR